MRHLLLAFLLITLFTSIHATNIRKLRNSLNAASNDELELLEMDIDMNGDMEMEMDMDMDADMEEELEDADSPSTNSGSNAVQATPNPGIIDSLKQKGSNLWKKGKGLFGKNTDASGKEGKKGGTPKPKIFAKWAKKLKKGGASTKAKFCRKFQKRPAHCPPCPKIIKLKSKKNPLGVPSTPTTATSSLTMSSSTPLPSTPQVLFESDMDIDGFPGISNFVNRICGPPTCDCPKPKKKKKFGKIKGLFKRRKHKPTQSTSQRISNPTNTPSTTNSVVPPPTTG